MKISSLRYQTAVFVGDSSAALLRAGVRRERCRQRGRQQKQRQQQQQQQQQQPRKVRRAVGICAMRWRSKRANVNARSIKRN
jgi:hypothetical protein